MSGGHDLVSFQWTDMRPQVWHLDQPWELGNLSFPHHMISCRGEPDNERRERRSSVQPGSRHIHFQRERTVASGWSVTRWFLLNCNIKHLASTTFQCPRVSYIRDNYIDVTFQIIFPFFAAILGDCVLYCWITSNMILKDKADELINKRFVQPFKCFQIHIWRCTIYYFDNPIGPCVPVSYTHLTLPTILLV